MTRSKREEVLWIAEAYLYFYFIDGSLTPAKSLGGLGYLNIFHSKYVLPSENYEKVNVNAQKLDIFVRSGGDAAKA